MKPIHLIPLSNGAGPLEPGLDQAGTPGGHAWPGLSALRAAYVPKPSTCRSHATKPGGQYYSTAILQRLERAADLDARVLGVTACDLYVPVLTFVFGEAQLDGNCAVVSTARLREEFYGMPGRDELYRERLVKEAAHELGHTFGLRHCADWRCVMSSSHGVERLDVKGADFCSSCRRKVLSNGFW